MSVKRRTLVGVGVQPSAIISLEGLAMARLMISSVTRERADFVIVRSSLHPALGWRGLVGAALRVRRLTSFDSTKLALHFSTIEHASRKPDFSHQAQGQA
jgi:hypothetical protein